ncbi:hypothetical protein CKO40_16025 [Halochromatium glycolicum]|uniref:TonB-dependent receptor n=2 Tax=Halochromatium glycolicum TaxID=85075 RepID=A0AAJ0XB60_9GAMM|nr:hypothetical protein [Halochromatium glycolicum]
MQWRGIQRWGLAVVGSWAIAGQAALAEPEMAVTFNDEALLLDPIEVSAPPIYSVQYPGDTLYTGSALTDEGKAMSGAAGRTNVYANLDLLPGVDSESLDPYGLGGTFMRVRGIKSQFVGMSIEGLPNYGIMPIGPRPDLYDFENIETLELYKGMAPLAIGSAVGNRGGAIALRFRRPEAEAAAELSQAIGSNAYQRSFARLDSGTFGPDLRAFVSGSYTDADKWRGAGSLGPRQNLAAGLGYGLDQGGPTVELFFNATDHDRNDFRALDYRQARNVGRYRDFDYNSGRTGDPAIDVDYFDYYHTSTENRDLLAIASLPLAAGTLSVKPYYAKEQAQIRNGKQDRVRDLNRYGINADFVGEVAGLEISTGYWWESADLEKSVRRMQITPTGREADGWVYLAENDGRGAIHSPYFQLGQQLGRLRWQAGIKYFRYTEPASTAFRTDATTPSDWDAARRDNLGASPDLSLDAFTFDAWLPNLGVSWALDPSGATELYANYGRNYMRPYAFVPVTNIVASNLARFEAAGLSLQDVFDDWRLETSDNVDLGLRLQRDRLALTPSIFYAKHHDLLAVAYDPRVGLNYHQNVGGATAWGAELLASLQLTPALWAFVYPTYLRFTFDEDLTRRGPGGTKTLPIAGQQVPDTPEWMLRAGLLFEQGPWRMAPVARYVGRRYADPQNAQPVDGYWSLDLTASWSSGGFGVLEGVRVGLELTNLLDEAYIGAINARDDGSGTVGFYPGAPRSAVLTLAAEF